METAKHRLEHAIFFFFFFFFKCAVLIKLPLMQEGGADQSDTHFIRGSAFCATHSSNLGRERFP